MLTLPVVVTSVGDMAAGIVETGPQFLICSFAPSRQVHERRVAPRPPRFRPGSVHLRQ